MYYDEIVGEEDDVFMFSDHEDERWNVALCFHRFLHEEGEDMDSLWEDESLS